jgi:hypothetical protein
MDFQFGRTTPYLSIVQQPFGSHASVHRIKTVITRGIEISPRQKKDKGNPADHQVSLKETSGLLASIDPNALRGPIATPTESILRTDRIGETMPMDCGSALWGNDLCELPGLGAPLP